MSGPVGGDQSTGGRPGYVRPRPGQRRPIVTQYEEGDDRGCAGDGEEDDEPRARGPAPVRLRRLGEALCFGTGG